MFDSTTADQNDPALTNDDLSPSVRRTWGWKDYLFLWMSNIHSVAGYVTIGSFLMIGLPVTHILAAMMVAIIIVQLGCNLMAGPSMTSGAPFPVVARMTFGVYGAAIPATIRGCIAIGWYGIQTWLASNALVILVIALHPAFSPLANASLHGFAGLSLIGWVAFLAVWGLQITIFWNGMNAVRRFIDWAGPAIYGMMIALVLWLLSRTGWHFPASLPVTKTASSLGGMLDIVTMVVAYFSPIVLNFGDFARYASSPDAVRKGNFLGLPLNFLAFSLLSLSSISLTLPVFGQLLTDPVETIARLDNTTASVIGIITFVIATAGINITANFVSAAFDFSSLAPQALSWRKGGLLAATAAIGITPWNLYARPELIHLTLDILGAFICPLAGIVITDYHIIRNKQVDIQALYSTRPQDIYWYSRGINPRALIALAGGTAVSIMLIFAPVWPVVASLSELTGLGVSVLLYLLLSSHPAFAGRRH
ncbi:MAG: NCS1 family nucleobase:cation symporter-1 [Acetobacter papayae]|uniref:NCS1 family nucleobase:cation symporter-1 n=1 Tax=Acetobacter papayae TaxID=1076592 RepID=UPI0039EC87E1